MTTTISLRCFPLFTSFFSVLLALLATESACAASRTWIGGDGTWTDGAGNNANWSGSDEPDTDDEAIFNSNNVIDLGSANSILALTMSASVEVNLNNSVLDVAGLTSLTGSGTRLEISATTATLNGQNVSISNSATVFLDGGTINSSIAGASTALISTASDGLLSGNGNVSFSESIAAITTVLDNNGIIAASNPATVIFTPPAAAMLHLSATDADARIDLDGSAENGVVSVGRNQTLDIDIPIFDIFNGGITMSHNTKLDMSSAWILGAFATVDIDNGAVGGIGGAPAGTATIAGASFSQNSGTITVVDTDGTLQFDAPFSMNGGTLTNNGHVIFNQTATIAAAANFDIVGDADFTVAANHTVTINQTNFNLDGSGAGGTLITVNNEGLLNVNVTDYDSDSVTNSFDGTFHLINGDISVTTGDAEFVMDGVLSMFSSVDGQIVVWTGEPLDIGNDAGSLDADLDVIGTRQSQIASEVDFNSDADVSVSSTATLVLLNTANFNTVNAANNAAIAGAGTIAFNGVVNVNEAVTLNMVGGTVDLDGLDNVGDFVNIDAPLTIKAATMASFGRVNGGGINTLDINNSVGTGVLTVNLDNAEDEWTLNAAGVMNLVNDGGGGNLLTGSDVNLNGTVNVTGGVAISARVDIAGTINVANLSALTLSGSNLADPNRLIGGMINGPGGFAVSSLRGLRGFGTINPVVHYTGSAELLADDGELTLNGAINDVGKIGTADADGVLNVVNAWTTSGADNVVLVGGELKGGTVTVGNANGVQGRGLISARVVNNTRLLADTGTLIVQTAANDNDWDGAGGTGQLNAVAGSTLELRDTGQFNFTGTATATGGSRILANGFGLNFDPGSTLNLTESTFEATVGGDIGGNFVVAAGAHSTLDVEPNFFLDFESTSATTLNANLRLLGNNLGVDAGATFAGTGALIVPDASHLGAENGANINVLLDNQGAFRPGKFAAGSVNLKDYQQSATGELIVDLTGTALNQFDRMLVANQALLDGALQIRVIPGFVPALNDVFTILSAPFGVSGTFDVVDVSEISMPANLAFRVNYLLTSVQLQVVNKPFFSADFDEDGDVDTTDYSIWRSAFKLNQLGDATGDNISDAADYVVWRKQFGSVPGAGSGAVTNTAVPEPTTAMLLIFGAACCCLRRGRAA
jgi:hypothetical protein